MKVKSNREWGEEYEKKVIKRLGGRHIPGSGSTAELKEDGDFPGIKLQVKGTQGDSVVIKVKDMGNLQKNSMNCGKIPVLFMGAPYQGEEWIAFPEWFLKTTQFWSDLINGRHGGAESENLTENFFEK